MRVETRERRSKFDIVARLLQLAAQGSTKTALVYRSNLNFKVVQKYVDLLQDNELLEVFSAEGLTYYHTTDKGVEALKAISTAMDLVSGDVVSGRDHLVSPLWARSPRARRVSPAGRASPLTNLDGLAA